MSDKPSKKERVRNELVEYLTNFLYLAVFFAVFTTYSRLLLAQYEITIGDYGVSVIKALILAKVIMIGDLMGVGRRRAGDPLIMVTLFKTVAFTVWVVLFHLLEETVVGLFHGHGIMGGLHAVLAEPASRSVANSMLVFFAFLPFFAFKQLGKVMGKERVHELFYVRAAEGSVSAEQRS